MFFSKRKKTYSPSFSTDVFNYNANGCPDLFLAEVNSEGQLKGTEHRGEVLGLGIMYQLPHAVVHNWVKEGQVMPADLAAKQVLQHMTVQIERTDLVL